MGSYGQPQNGPRVHPRPRGGLIDTSRSSLELRTGPERTAELGAHSHDPLGFGPGLGFLHGTHPNCTVMDSYLCMRVLSSTLSKPQDSDVRMYI